MTLESLFQNDNLDQAHLDQALRDLPFEHGVKLLEQLVGQVESGALSLEKSISSFERGTLIISHLRSLLSGAEEKVRVLMQGKPAE